MWGLVTIVERDRELAVGLRQEHAAEMSMTGSAALANELRNLVGLMISPSSARR
jgi:hypothetical protein